MTSGAPWSVKGIDPKAREVAKDLARRSGMTLGEWLNRMIFEEDGPEDISSEAYFTDPNYVQRTASLATADRPVRTYYETPRYEAPIRPEPVREPPSRFEAPEHPADEIGRVTLALDRLTDRIESSEGRTGLAISGVEHSVREAVDRIEAAEREHVAIAARFEGAVEETRADHAVLLERLRRVEAEAAGPRSAEALRALEQALGRVANHLYEGEGRTRQVLADLRAKVEKAEAGQPAPSVEIIEEVVDRVGARLNEAESRTSEALEGLRASFAGLEGRVNSVEAAAAPALEQQFEQLQASLTLSLASRVDAARDAIAGKQQAASDTRFDRMERKLAEMTDQVRLAEQRSAQAIERMGREVMSVADTLTRRVESSETRGAAAIGQVGGEVARIAQAVEAKLSRNDVIQAEAMEKLGVEIGRISERLAERIANAERRSAQAIDDVGEQVNRVTERMNQRGERASDELVERIRLSEERTARLLEEAREKIDQRLLETQRRAAEVLPSPAAPSGPAPYEAASEAFGEPEPFPAFTPLDADEERSTPPAFMQPPVMPGAGGMMTRSGFATPKPPLKSAAPPPVPAAAERAFEAPALYAPEPFPAEPERATFDADDFEAADGFSSAVDEPPQGELEPEDFSAGLELAAAAQGPVVESISATQAPEVEDPASESQAFETAAFEPADSDPFETQAFETAAFEAEDERVVAETESPTAFADEPEASAQPLSTREVIEQARAAARAAGHNDGKVRKLKVRKSKDDDGPRDGGTPTASIFASMFSRPKRRAGSSLQTALVVVGGAAFFGVAAAGFMLMAGKPGGATPKRVAEQIAAFSGGKEIAGSEADTTPFPDTPRVAVALSPQPIVPVGPAQPTAPDLGERFARAADVLSQSKPAAPEALKAVNELKAVAELGHAPAQFYLAKLYEKGESGLKKDPVLARRWTERAAEGGERRAMHNLAMAYIAGTGGPKNSTTAAQWFRRAADLGLVDAQFNLAVLYEQGLGVSQNAAEAYKWYLIAGKSGDSDAHKRADQAKVQLSADARAVAERAALTFRPTTPNASAAPVATADLGANNAGLIVAQRALSRLGYYQGPTDGSPSPALKMAVAAYQRDQNVSATGVLDQATLQRLSVFTR